ncbi:retinol dehydrogenase 12-like [Excalfactoria chinensis]|uniref:retinol dehydrogenase 12-like n=1 Tax=Excalfactoria chinensis TaxID=46218 RepID=UPI003B3A683C
MWNRQQESQNHNGAEGGRRERGNSSGAHSGSSSGRACTPRTEPAAGRGQPAGSSHTGEQPGVSSGTRCAQLALRAAQLRCLSRGDTAASCLCSVLQRLAEEPYAAAGRSEGSCTVPRLRGRVNILSWTLSLSRSSVPRPPPATAMELPSFCSHPLWFVLALLLGLLLWATRRRGWDPRECPTDLTGKTVIVTGANSGIGKCVAMDLARRNARTILACRSRERGQAAAEEIRAATGNPDVLPRLLDCSSLASVRAFAGEVLREEKRLDVLVNNAGVTGLPFGVTAEGLERTFATNYLGPFLLTNLLLDLMRASAPARIVTVSSFRHSAGSADGRYLTGQRRPGGYDPMYNSSKLMNVLFSAELARRLQGTGVTANSLNPGVVSTGIMRNFSWAVRGLFFLISPFIKSAQQGAVSTIYCAVSEEASGISGKYFDSDCSLTLPSAAARDAGLARKLWEESERLTGLSP